MTQPIKKLHLSKKDRKLVGVCGGIAEYFEVDSTVIRLAWVALTLVTGIVPGVVGYVAAMIIIPRQS